MFGIPEQGHPAELSFSGFAIIFFHTIWGGRSMEEKKVFEEPEVTTYDRDELNVEIAHTNLGNSIFE
jgi:hypothetical protein